MPRLNDNIEKYINYCSKKNIDTIDNIIYKLSCGCESQQISQDIGISVKHSNNMYNVYNMIGGDSMKDIAKVYCATNAIANSYKGGDNHNHPISPNTNTNTNTSTKWVSHGKNVIKTIDKGVDKYDYATKRAGTVANASVNAAQSIQQIANAGKDIKSIFSKAQTNVNRDINAEIARIDKEIATLQMKKRKLIEEKQKNHSDHF